MRGGLKTFAGPFPKAFSDLFHEHVLKEAENIIKLTRCNNEENWHADYVRLRVSARKC